MNSGFKLCQPYEGQLHQFDLLMKKKKKKLTYKVNLSFQAGFSDALMVLVFFFELLSSSGINFTFTYGSARPFGSIGFRFFASRTENIQRLNS